MNTHRQRYPPCPKTSCPKASLQSIAVPDSVTEIGHNAFSGCSSLKEAAIGSGVKTIGLYTFRDCVSLESVILSDGLETIGDEAFFNTSIRTIALPGSIKRPGVRAFDFENWKKSLMKGQRREFEAVVNDAFESAYSSRITVECTDGVLIYNDSPAKDTTEATAAASSEPGSNAAPETTGKTESPSEETGSLRRCRLFRAIAIFSVCHQCNGSQHYPGTSPAAMQNDLCSAWLFLRADTYMFSQ